MKRGGGIFYAFLRLPITPRPPCPQLDTKWAEDPGFVLYDFTQPENIPQDLRGTFDMVVVDPPFITREVGGILFLRVITGYLALSPSKIGLEQKQGRQISAWNCCPFRRTRSFTGSCTL